MIEPVRKAEDRDASGEAIPPAGETQLSALRSVPQDMNETASEIAAQDTSPVWRWPMRLGTAMRAAWLRIGLPAKLLLLTAVFVMLAEMLIFLPSIANYRISWLNDRLTAANVAALAAEAVPGRNVPPALRNELLRTALVRAVAIRRGGAPPPRAAARHRAFHRRALRSAPAAGHDGRPGPLRPRLADPRRHRRVLRAGRTASSASWASLGPRYDDVIEIVLPEEPLRRAMVRYGLNIVYLSIMISLITAALVYFAISALLVRPMMRISRNMLQLRREPRGSEPHHHAVRPARRDRHGRARAAARCSASSRRRCCQKNRLAQLGLAVSKISHDLRNMLANAQLISDRLTAIPDPTVQQFAPKLIASLDRAINFCNTTLRFGRAEEAAPRRELMRLKPLVEEVGEASACRAKARSPGSSTWTSSCASTPTASTCSAS